MYIVRPDVEEADLDKLIEGFEKNVTDGGGEVKGTEKMGRRRLAYTVRKFNDGFYVLMTIAHRRGREAAGEDQGHSRHEGEAQLAAFGA